jgi:hypothetical protein
MPPNLPELRKVADTLLTSEAGCIVRMMTARENMAAALLVDAYAQIGIPFTADTNQTL